MDNTEAIKELKEIIEDRKSYLVGDYDKSLNRHIEALEYAIKELEKTAPEVPVQEQSISSYLKANITINGLDELKNISTDSSLEIDTICTDKTSVEINLQS